MDPPIRGCMMSLPFHRPFCRHGKSCCRFKGGTSDKLPQKRLDALMEVLIGKVRFDAENDRYGTRTAQETYDAGTANCLSLSNLFVAIARYVGLSVQFQEVPTTPNWIRTGEVLFSTRHIGALVDVNKYQGHMVHLGYGEENRIIVWKSASNRYFFSPSNLDSTGAEINPRFGNFLS